MAGEHFPKAKEGTDGDASPYPCLKALWKTYVGGLLIHILLAGSWVLPILFVALTILYMMIMPLTPYFTATILFVLLALKWPVKPSPEFVRMCEEMGPSYFYRKCELISKCDRDDVSKEKSLFAFYPHGALSVGFAINGCWSKEFRDSLGGRAIFLVSEALHRFPGFSILAGLAGGDRGNFQSANATNMKRLMTAGHNVAIIPGGFEDATLMQFGKDRIYIKQRKGFIKMALRFGYKVFPVYTFNESKTFVTFPYFQKLRLWLSSFKIPAVLMWGHPFFFFVPIPSVDIYTVVGKPLQLPKLEEPSVQDIDMWHGIFVDALNKLFEDNKEACGLKSDARLEMF